MFIIFRAGNGEPENEILLSPVIPIFKRTLHQVNIFNTTGIGSIIEIQKLCSKRNQMFLNRRICLN